MMSDNQGTVLLMKGISKSFYANKVLNKVDFELRHGEIHALLGENGAGKSTLLNILTGTFRSDEGEIYLNGKRVEIRSLPFARDLGIVRVHQELQLIPEMSVGQNIFLGREPKTKFNLINYKEIYRRSDEILKKLNADFSSREKISTLSTAQMQMVEISKALLQDFTVLALDEPTSSLTNNEIEKLMQTMDQLRRGGKSIIYISHRMDEIFKIADRATILRDGNMVGVVNIPDITRPELIRMMVGRDISEQCMNQTAYIRDEDALVVKHLHGKGFSNISFTLKKGEVLGFSGLVGAGRTEIAQALFGIDPATSGDIYINGRKVRIRRPSDAKKYGVMLIPEDRKLHGMVGILPNKSNIVLSHLEKYRRYGIITHKRIAEDADKFIRMFQVTPANAEIETRNLSGGNQQKIVLSRNMNVEPDILILDEPTRGIDINVKFEIYKLIRRLAKEGKAVILISSELPEIIGLSDRTVIMYEGKIRGELTASEMNEERVMTYAMGGCENGEE